ncbi:MAG: mechanosensitive ion channel [Phycisphaerales bacterium]|nr:mechanosensitive ion channel [Phycisphaerales bacterium]
MSRTYGRWVLWIAALALAVGVLGPTVWAQHIPGVTDAIVPGSQPAAGVSPVAVPAGERGALARIWDFEIARFDNRPITLGTIALGLVLFIVGLWLSRLLSAMLGRRILPHVGVDTDAAAAFQRVFFYVLLIGFTLVALNIVNVPLTVFTVLGGAIAIGVGFGAQAIINNFISGWILLAERQVNIGDLVEVDGSVGHVRSIGARCTHVRRPDGIDLLVPNSQMLERTVVNWTLTDANVRTTVRVGVVYGSPVDKVTELIRTTVDEHEKILRSPAPIIIFEDFGDNALIFDVYFWVYTTAEMELRRVRSDVRYTIDRLFRAEGIVIAFPQRDLHLDTAKPLEVRMLPADGGASAGVDGPAEACSVPMLRRVELLRSLDHNDLAELAGAARSCAFAAGEPIVKEGQDGSSLFILAQGMLRVTVQAAGAARKVGQLLPGQFFGEVSLLTGEPRTATVTALTRAVVYEIDHDMLAPVLQRRPEVVRKLSEALAARKSATDEHVRRAGQTSAAVPRTLVTELRDKISAFFGLS